MNLRTLALAATTAGVAGGMLIAFRWGFGAGLAAGYQYGEQDGERKARTGPAPAERQSTLAQHYARNVAQVPGAEDFAAGREAVRMSLVRRSVHGLEGWS